MRHISEPDRRVSINGSLLAPWSVTSPEQAVDGLFRVCDAIAGRIFGYEWRVTHGHAWHPQRPPWGRHADLYSGVLGTDWPAQAYDFTPSLPVDTVDGVLSLSSVLGFAKKQHRERVAFASAKLGRVGVGVFVNVSSTDYRLQLRGKTLPDAAQLSSLLDISWEGQPTSKPHEDEDEDEDEDES
jgi:hypothetical protein